MESKDEIMKMLIESAKLSYKRKMKIMTEMDTARDKELYFKMKTITKSPNWNEAYKEFGRRPRQKDEW